MEERGANGSGIWISEEFRGNLWAHSPRTCRSKRCTNYIVGSSAAKMNPVRRASGMPSEGKSANQLDWAPSAGGGQDLAHIVGEITCRILEDGVPVTS